MTSRGGGGSNPRLERVILLKSEARRWSLNKRFEDFLGVYFPGKVGEVCQCGNRLASYSDANGHFFWRPLKCRVRDLCPSCANAYRKTLTDDAVSEIAKIYSRFRMPIAFVTGELTFPPEIQDRLAGDAENMVSTMALRFIKEVFSDGGRYQLAGEISVHHWRSKTPFSGQFIHVHFTLLNLSLLKAERRFVKNYLVAHMKPERLAEVRRTWTRIVNEEFGTGFEETFSHFYHSKGLGHLRHRLEYSFRLPIHDVYRVVAHEVDPSDIDPDWVRKMLDRNGSKAKRVRWFGWLQESCRREAFAILEVEYRTKAQRDKERKKVYCPRCGLEMHIVSASEKWEDVTEDVPCVLGWRETGGGLLGR